jgi:hydroxymethylpyrimidine pyrophosphatase-like HAD family hydrolase
MKPLFLTDCDDTLFMTARKIRDVPIDECEIASTLTDGSPSGYRTPRLVDLRSLMESGDVVPVTARSRDVLARCAVPQAPAICSNGGVIVGEDGEIDAQWHAAIVSNVGDGVAIRDIHQTAARMAGEGFRHWTVDEDGVPLYIVLKSNESDETAVSRLATDIDDDGILPEGWRIHVNGNNLALMPPWISKRAAARHLLRRIRTETPQRLVIGVGDSVSDLGFMEECDFAMHPTDSQIGRHLAKGHQW